MSNPISIAFKKANKENRPALLTYTVAGDSSKKQSLSILKSISKNADILEVGVPHNTPVADGSQIQTSAYRAIKNGIKINDIFQVVKDFKKLEKSKPIILMGYYNMIFQYGENNFLKKCFFPVSHLDGSGLLGHFHPCRELALLLLALGLPLLALGLPLLAFELLLLALGLLLRHKCRAPVVGQRRLGCACERRGVMASDGCCLKF